MHQIRKGYINDGEGIHWNDLQPLKGIFFRDIKDGANVHEMLFRRKGSYVFPSPLSLWCPASSEIVISVMCHFCHFS